MKRLIDKVNGSPTFLCHRNESFESFSQIVPRRRESSCEMYICSILALYRNAAQVESPQARSKRFSRRRRFDENIHCNLVFHVMALIFISTPRRFGRACRFLTVNNGERKTRIDFSRPISRPPVLLLLSLPLYLSISFSRPLLRPPTSK